MSQKLIRIFLCLRANPILKWIGYFLLKMVGVEIPPSVKIGKNFTLVHEGVGVVIHPNCVIGNNVQIYQGVTIGRADVYKECAQGFEITLGDDIILCAGSKLICKEKTYISNGFVLGANSVLLGAGKVDTGTYVGLPAKKIK